MTSGKEGPRPRSSGLWVACVRNLVMIGGSNGPIEPTQYQPLGDRTSVPPPCGCPSRRNTRRRVAAPQAQGRNRPPPSGHPHREECALCAPYGNRGRRRLPGLPVRSGAQRGGGHLKQTVHDAHQAEVCFQQALAIARCQQAKSWELRAAVQRCQGRCGAQGGQRPQLATWHGPKGMLRRNAAHGERAHTDRRRSAFTALQSGPAAQRL